MDIDPPMYIPENMPQSAFNLMTRLIPLLWVVLLVIVVTVLFAILVDG